MQAVGQTPSDPSSPERERIGILAALTRAVSGATCRVLVLEDLELTDDRPADAAELVIDLEKLYEASFQSIIIRNCKLSINGVLLFVGGEYPLSELVEDGFDPEKHLEVELEDLTCPDVVSCTLCFQGAFDGVTLRKVNLTTLALGRQDIRGQFLCWKLALLNCYFTELWSMFWEKLSVLDIPRINCFGCGELHWSGGSVLRVQWTMHTSCEVRSHASGKSGERVLYEHPEIGLIHVTGTGWFTFFRSFCPDASVRFVGETIAALDR